MVGIYKPEYLKGGMGMCHDGQNGPMIHSGLPEGAVVASRPIDEIRQRPPRMPIRIDECEEDPRAITELDGQRLHYVMDAAALRGELLHVFTDQHTAEQFFSEEVEAALAPALKDSALREKAGNFSSPLQEQQMDAGLFATRKSVSALSAYPPGGVPPLGGYLDLYEHIDWGGCSWRILETGKTTWNLQDLWACGFLWWGWINADLRVSCIDARISGEKPIYILADQSNLGGNWFWMPGRSFVPSLVPYGWNDRARSSTIWYFA